MLRLCFFTFRLFCRATRPIDEGEELTVSYVDTSLSTEDRLSYLREQFFFTCKCPRCHDESSSEWMQPTLVDKGWYICSTKTIRNCTLSWSKCNICHRCCTWEYLLIEHQWHFNFEETVGFCWSLWRWCCHETSSTSLTTSSTSLTHHWQDIVNLIVNVCNKIIFNWQINPNPNLVTRTGYVPFNSQRWVNALGTLGPLVRNNLKNFSNLKGL